MIHRKQFGLSMKKKKESLEEDMNRIETYIKKLDKPIIVIDTKNTADKPKLKNANNYKTTIKI